MTPLSTISKKPTLVFLLILATSITGCSKKEEVKTPSQIGPQVMTLLNDMGEITKPEFSDYFISANGLKALAENKDLDISYEQRKAMSSTTRQEIKVRYNFMYKRLKVSGRSKGVNWPKAKMEDFTFKKVTHNGMNFCEGVLFFSYAGRTFSVNTRSVFDGDKYLLTSVDGLTEIRE